MEAYQGIQERNFGRRFQSEQGRIQDRNQRVLEEEWIIWLEEHGIFG